MTAPTFLSLMSFLSLWSLQAQTAEPPGCRLPKVSLFAASSLAVVEADLKKAALTECGANLQINLASSTALLSQIKHGATCNIVITADQLTMDALSQSKLVRRKTRKTLLKNRLVLVTKKDHEPLLSDPKRFFQRALKRPDIRIAIGDPRVVPAGRYAQHAMTKIKLYPSESGTAWNKLNHTLIFAPNVRIALAWVEQSVVCAAAVYHTDAMASSGTRVLFEFDSKSHAPIEYPIAECLPEISAETQCVLDMLTSEKVGKTIFESKGFLWAQ